MKRVLTLCVFIAIVISISLSAYSAEVYIWTDEKGVKQITDTPPPKPTIKVETMHSADSALRLKIMDMYGVDPDRFQDIYDFAAALSPEKYKQFVDNYKGNEARGFKYTIDGTGKITKMIPKYEMERYRKDRDEQKRRDYADRLKAYSDYMKQAEIENKMRLQREESEYRQKRQHEESEYRQKLQREELEYRQKRQHEESERRREESERRIESEIQQLRNSLRW